MQDCMQFIHFQAMHLGLSQGTIKSALCVCMHTLRSSCQGTEHR
jgi:hypothetical protein